MGHVLPSTGGVSYFTLCVSLAILSTSIARALPTKTQFQFIYFCCVFLRCCFCPSQSTPGLVSCSLLTYLFIHPSYYATYTSRKLICCFFLSFHSYLYIFSVYPQPGCVKKVNYYRDHRHNIGHSPICNRTPPQQI